MAAPTAPPVYMLGAGQLWIVANGGNLPANPTPIRMATLQSVDLEFSGDIKELYGETQYPEVVAIGKRKVTGKIKIGRWNTFAMNQLMFADTYTPASLQIVTTRESFTITGGTYTVSGAAHFAEDLGVEYANQTPFTEVAASPAAGQYSVNPATGVYTFNSSDNTNAALVSYSQTATTGVTLAIDNQVMGWGPVFQLVLNAPFRGQQSNLVLNACISGKLSWGTKVDDFRIPEIDFSAFQDQNGRIGYIYASQ